MKIDTMKLKQLNIELLKAELLGKESSTKNSLSEATGLSVATCGNILSELIASGEVIEIENAGSTGGRRSRQFKLNSNHAFTGILYARIEAGERSIYTAVFNMKGDLIEDHHYVYEDISLTEIDSCIEIMTARFKKIKSLCIGLPGIVNRGVVGLCDLKLLENIPVEKYLSEKYMISVAAVNDVNAAVLGYFRKETRSDYESIVYIYCPEYGNPGAGILVNGKILKGKSDFAGEISFLPLSEGRESQDEIQRDLYSFSDYIVKIIRSINAVLDPEIIVLTGRRFNPEVIKKIKKQTAELIPDAHQPVIGFEEDLHDSFSEGLRCIAGDNLGIGIKLVEN